MFVVLLLVSRPSRKVENIQKKPPERPAPPVPSQVNFVSDNKDSDSSSETEQGPVSIINNYIHKKINTFAEINVQYSKTFQPLIEEEAKPTEEAVDLLNLNFTPTVNSTAPKQSPSSNFDLLSGLNDVSNENFGFDTTAPTANQNAPKPDDLFDPFASLGGGNSNNLLGGWSNFNAPVTNAYPQSNASEQTEQKQTDPFAGLSMYTCMLLRFYFCLYFSTLYSWFYSLFHL